jgi:hypothetical protein
MLTIVVNAADRAVMTGDPIPGWQPKKILDCLDEPIPNVGDPRALDGRPCILFGMLNNAEDWSGEYVNPNLHPFALIDAPKLTTPEFWTLVRKVHGLPESATATAPMMRAGHSVGPSADLELRDSDSDRT